MFHGHRRRRAKSQVKIWMEDIPQIIARAVKMQWFNVGGRCFKQVCGSPMGSPLSPALCLMVIARKEQIWHDTFRNTLQGFRSETLLMRYVDNRAVLASAHAFNTHAIRQFFLPQFYGGRIILEEEQEWTFLGFDIDLVRRRVKFDFKLAQESFTSIHLATPPRVILSGVLARAAMIRRCSFPQEKARDD